MKKILASIILLAYFMVSTGFVMSVHYCMDRFDSANLGASHNDKCDKCGMHKGKNNCCRDEVKVVKLETSHLASKVLITDFSLPVLHEVNTAFLFASFTNARQIAPAVANSPPINEQDTYLQNCVFRI